MTEEGKNTMQKSNERRSQGSVTCTSIRPPAPESLRFDLVSAAPSRAVGFRVFDSSPRTHSSPPSYPLLPLHPPHTSLPSIDAISNLQLQGLAMTRGKSKADVPKKADTKLAVKKGSERVAKKPRKSKADKDPNKPKRPPSAFFVFMEEFRKTYKEKHPNNKSVAVVGKAGGDKWKSLSEDEKAPYVAKAAKLKSDYTKTMAAYNKGQSGGGSRTAAAAAVAADDDEESDKSKSEVNDDEEDEEDEDEEDDD